MSLYSNVSIYKPQKTILATGEVYHVYNRSIQKIPIFTGKRECDLFLESLRYYLQAQPPVKFSIYRTNREKYQVSLKDKIVTLVNYNLMPNHFHFTLRQETEDGIKKFIQKTCNSFAHYFNMKYDNKGSLFESSFQYVHITTNEQLIHLSRYIHLNAVTAYLVEKPEDYKYSSYRIYTGEEKSDFVDPSLVLDQFPSKEKYREFVMAQKDYQRELDKIKHLILE